MQRWMDSQGLVWVHIRCGCCGLKFDAIAGGSAFCGSCISGQHLECHVGEIMGKR